MGTSNATNDILNNPRFQGAIESISGITSFVDNVFVMFISFIAFFIISAALLRNVVAGAYAAYPKLWDEVNEAKQMTWRDSFGHLKNFASEQGAFKKFFFKLLPDFKKISDFDNDTIAPKDYFAKAIPQMVGIVMIGAFIYNGFYRDVVSVTTTFGSEMISRTLLSIDPVATFDKIANTTGGPKCASNSDTDEGSLAKDISKSIYRDIVSFYTDVKSEAAKSKLGKDIENYVYTEILSKCKDYLDSDRYKSTIQITRVNGNPDISKFEGESGNITTFAFSKSVTSFGIDTVQHKNEEWYERIIVRFEKKAKKQASLTSRTNLELSIGNADVKNEANSGKVIIDLGKYAGDAKFSISGSTKIGDYSLGRDSTSKMLVIEGVGGNSLNGKELTISGSLFYSIGGGNHQIKTIKIVPGLAKPIFKDKDGKSQDFNWGDKPVIKEK